MERPTQNLKQQIWQQVLINHVLTLRTLPFELDSHAWFAELGASYHLTPFETYLHSKQPYIGMCQVHVRNGHNLKINTIGQSRTKKQLILASILHVPSITRKWIPISNFLRDNIVMFDFYPNKCYVKSQGSKEVLLEVFIKSYGLYCFTNLILDEARYTSISKRHGLSFVASKSNVPNSSIVNSSALCHCRLGHSNVNNVKSILKLCNIPS